MMLWLSVSVILKNKTAFDTQKGANLGIKCARMRLAVGRRRTRWGSFSATPDTLAAIGGKGAYFERGMGKGKEGDGNREREDGKGMEGREGSPCIRSHK